MANVSLTELEEREKTLAHHWNIIDTIKVPMWQSNDELQSYQNFFITLAYCQDRVLAIFNHETPAKLIAAAKWDPPTLWRGPAYNQLIIDTVFSISNLVTFSAVVEDMGKIRNDMFLTMLEKQKALEKEKNRLVVANSVKLTKIQALDLKIETFKVLVEQLQAEKEILKIAASATNGAYNEKEHFEIDL